MIFNVATRNMLPPPLTGIPLTLIVKVELRANMLIYLEPE
jgi:hypothetical protein